MWGRRHRPAAPIGRSDQLRYPILGPLATSDRRECADHGSNELGQESVRNHPDLDANAISGDDSPPCTDLESAAMVDRSRRTPSRIGTIGPGNPFAATGERREIVRPDQQLCRFRHRVDVEASSPAPDLTPHQRLIVTTPDAVAVFPPGGVIPGMKSSRHPADLPDRDVVREMGVDRPGQYRSIPFRSSIAAPGHLTDRMNPAVRSSRERGRRTLEADSGQGSLEVILNRAHPCLLLRSPQPRAVVRDCQLQGVRRLGSGHVRSRSSPDSEALPEAHDCR